MAWQARAAGNEALTARAAPRGNRGDISKENFFYKCPVVRAAPCADRRCRRGGSATLTRGECVAARAVCAPRRARSRAQCDSGKNRFKAQEKTGGSAYAAMAAAKKQAKVRRRTRSCAQCCAAARPAAARAHAR